MTQFGMNNGANHSDRILTSPCLPTYIARRPVRSKSNAEITVKPYNPIFTSNWQKATPTHVTHYHKHVHSPFIDIELEQTPAFAKQYDTYKPTFYPRIEMNLTDSFNRIRPLSVPNHTTRTSEKWSRFLDEYPNRFNIEYPSPDDENHFYVSGRPGRFPCRTPGAEPPNQYGGLISPIQPVNNTFRQFNSTQAPTCPVWIPYGTAPRPYQMKRV